MADNNQVDDWEDVAEDDWEEIPVQEAAPKVSRLETSARALSHGGLLGFSDEGEGILRAAKDVMGDEFELKDFKDRYQAGRGEARYRNELARQQHPELFTGMEIAGSVGTAFLPTGPLGLIAKGATMGGAAGLGTSTADLTKGEFKDAAMDTAGGVALGGALSAIPAATRLGAKGYTKVPEGAIKATGQGVGFLKGGLAGAWAGGEVAEKTDKILRPLAQKMSQSKLPQNFKPSGPSSPFYKDIFSGQSMEQKRSSAMALLDKAREKGPQYVALTMQLLSKSDPELVQSLQP